MGRPIVTNEGLFTIGNSQCAADRLLLGELWELQARRAGDACRLARGVGVASRRSNAAILPRGRGKTCFLFPILFGKLSCLLSTFQRTLTSLSCRIVS